MGAGVLRREDTAPSNEPARGDEELAREINTEHGYVETHKRNTIQHAIRCGELLLEMKQRVGHGNWLTWLDEHFHASERTARNYIQIAKSAAVADLHDDTTMRSALRALASRPQSQETTSEPNNRQASKPPATGPVPNEDDARTSGADAFEAPRAGLGKTHQRTWASVPARLITIKRVFSEAAGEELDDHSASEVLYRASREAHQAATDLEQLAAALERRAA